MKLTEEDVDEIKFMYENGMPIKDIAYVFQVDRDTISDSIHKPRKKYAKGGIDKRLFADPTIQNSGCRHNGNLIDETNPVLEQLIREEKEKNN
jgi:predicted DNA-binding protein YlxM (UPF0122 family)